MSPVSRDMKGLIMGVWLGASLLNVMLLLFNLEAWGNGVHDDGGLLFLNFGSAVLCAYGYTQAKNMRTKEDE